MENFGYKEISWWRRNLERAESRNLEFPIEFYSTVELCIANFRCFTSQNLNLPKGFTVLYMYLV